MLLAHTPISSSDLAPFAVSAPVNPAAAYLESLNSEESKRTMVSPLNSAAKLLNPALQGNSAWRGIPWEKLTAPVIRALMAALSGSPATRNKALAAFKGVARSAWELRLLDTDELMRIRSIKGDAGSREPAGRYITSGEIAALLETCARDPSPAGARDGAMISLAAVTGARRAEIAAISLDGVVADDEGRYRIQIIGKRNRQRTLHLTGNAARALSEWIEIRFNSAGPLFCAIRKGGEILREAQISPTAVDKILRKRSVEANLTDIDWHDLRRTNVSNLLDAGADIATVAGLAGHANVQTTARYDRRGERASMKAAELISVPYFLGNR